HTWIDPVKEVLVLIHPDLDNALSVVVYDAPDPAWPRVRGSLAENMADPRTGYNVNLAPAHPHLPKSKTKVLSTPDVHAFIIRAYLIEIVSVYRKQASRHGGLVIYAVLPSGHTAVAAAPVQLSLRHLVPAEVELPVEASPGHVRACDVLKRVVADHVNDGAHHRRP
ncbi:hypothetical protein EGW08_022658, partial [Elysia chlorotica]